MPLKLFSNGYFYGCVPPPFLLILHLCTYICSTSVHVVNCCFCVTGKELFNVSWCSQHCYLYVVINYAFYFLRGSCFFVLKAWCELIETDVLFFSFTAVSGRCYYWKKRSLEGVKTMCVLARQNFAMSIANCLIELKALSEEHFYPSKRHDLL